MLFEFNGETYEMKVLFATAILERGTGKIKGWQQGVERESIIGGEFSDKLFGIRNPASFPIRYIQFHRPVRTVVELYQFDGNDKKSIGTGTSICTSFEEVPFNKNIGVKKALTHALKTNTNREFRTHIWKIVLEFQEKKSRSIITKPQPVTTSVGFGAGQTNVALDSDPSKTLKK